MYVDIVYLIHWHMSILYKSHIGPGINLLLMVILSWYYIKTFDLFCDLVHLQHNIFLCALLMALSFQTYIQGLASELRQARILPTLYALWTCILCSKSSLENSRIDDNMYVDVVM